MQVKIKGKEGGDRKMPAATGKARCQITNQESCGKIKNNKNGLI